MHLEENLMRIHSALARIAFPAIAATLLAAPAVFAQGGTICPQKQFSDIAAKPTVSGTPSAATPLKPGEEAAYSAFFKLPSNEIDQRIQAGDDFVQKFPGGPYSEAVYSQLSTAAYQKQDYAKMEAYADKALALNPDDVTVLVFTGWVIPHASNPAPASLEKAAKYEAHVLELLPNLPKPAAMSDKEFAAAKSQYQSQAHSGLGLVAYRRNDLSVAASELRLATAGPTQADPADLYILGTVLDRLARYSEASTAYHSCAAIPGAEQSVCRAKARAAKQNASAAASSPVVTASQVSAPGNSLPQ
jgi:tetratricopeptide (TPR) repeat protein